MRNTIQIVCYSNSSRTIAFRTDYGHAHQVRYIRKMSPLIYYTFLYLLLVKSGATWAHSETRQWSGRLKRPLRKPILSHSVLQCNPYSLMSFTAVVSANCYIIQYINSKVITEYLGKSLFGRYVVGWHFDHVNYPPDKTLVPAYLFLTGT